MITIQSAESALKNIYLDSMAHDLNTKTNPLLTMLYGRKRTVQGKEARMSVRSDDGIVDLERPLDNLYGTLQISGKAIRMAQNNAGAFASLLSAECKNLIDTGKSGYNETLYKWLREQAEETSVKITYDNLENDIREYLDQAQENGYEYDLIIMHPKLRRKLLDNLKDSRLRFEQCEIAGYFKGFTLDFTQAYGDIKARVRELNEETNEIETVAWEIYFINSNEMELQELCDWTWLCGDDGNILKQVDGKPMYQATLVKYANIIAKPHSIARAEIEVAK